MPRIEFITPNWVCNKCDTPAQQPVRIVDGKLSPTYFYLPQKCKGCGKLLNFYKVLEGYTVQTIKKADKVLV